MSSETGKKSRTKGASGEREFCRRVATLTDGRVNLRHNLAQCRDRGDDTSVYNFSIEIKRHKTASDGQVRQGWQQCQGNAAAQAKVPVRAFRADQQSWQVLHRRPDVVDTLLEDWASWRYIYKSLEFGIGNSSIVRFSEPAGTGGAGSMPLWLGRCTGRALLALDNDLTLQLGPDPVAQLVVLYGMPGPTDRKARPWRYWLRTCRTYAAVPGALRWRTSPFT